VCVTMKCHDVYWYPGTSPTLPTNEQGSHMADMLQTTVMGDELGRQVIARYWCDARGERHWTTGPAVEHWTVLPGGAHVLSYQAWYVNGNRHREDRPAWRRWHVSEDGSRVLEIEGWYQHDRGHRVGGPSYRRWTVEPDGTRALASECWRANGKLHRVDGPTYGGHGFYWHDAEAREEDLPWLRRGRSFLATLAGGRGAGPQGVDAASTPAWSRDARVAMTGASSASSTPAAYRSAVGGTALLSV